MRVRCGRNRHFRATGEESFAGVKSRQIEANRGSTSRPASLRTRAGRGAGIGRSCRGYGSGSLVGGRRGSALFAGCGGEWGRRLKFRIGRGDRIRSAKNHDLADRGEMPGRKRGRQVRNRDGEVRAHESAANSLLRVLISNGDQFGASAVCRGVDGPRDRSEPIARNFPLIRRAGRIGFGRSFETGIVVCHDGQIPIRKKYTALGFFELRRRFVSTHSKERSRHAQSKYAARSRNLRAR